jgi:hypothetical protein
MPEKQTSTINFRPLLPSTFWGFSEQENADLAAPVMNVGRFECPLLAVDTHKSRDSQQRLSTIEWCWGQKD